VTNRPTALLSPRILRFALLALGVYIVEGIAATSAALDRRPVLVGGAITFDLVVAVPLAWWLLVVRKGAASLRSLLPVVLLSMLGARLVLPTDHQGALPWMRVLVAPLELGVIAWVAWQVRATVRARRVARGGLADAGVDVRAELLAVLAPALGRGTLATVVATEIGLLHYVLTPWARTPHAPAGARTFAHERNGGLVAGLLIAITAETIPLHLFVAARWGALAAWVLTGLSVYGALWLVGDYRAIAMRPIVVRGDEIVIRHGLRTDIAISRSRIARAERPSWRTLPERAPDYLDLSRPGEPNVVLELDAPVEARLPFGMRRTVSRIGLRVEEAEAFVGALPGRDASGLAARAGHTTQPPTP
jgi:hypothetical protein